MSYEGAITPAYIQLPDAPTRENYNFQGWTDVPDSEEGKWTAGQENVPFENKENTVYAAWKDWLYHCNWCDQDTNEIHYRCPVHYTSQSCVRTQTTCQTGGICGGTLSCLGYTQLSSNGTDSSTTKSFTCVSCGSIGSSANGWYLAVLKSSSTTVYVTCQKCNASAICVVPSGSNGFVEPYWHKSHRN